MIGNYDPVSFKYISGWGADQATAPTIPAEGATLAEIVKMLKRFSRKDREYFKDKWQKLYQFYSETLLEEQVAQAALTDGYLKKLDKQLDL